MRSAWALLLSVSVFGLVGCAAADPNEANGSTESDMIAGGSGNAQVTGAGNGLRIRSGPNTSSATLGMLANGARVDVRCTVKGEDVGGDESWDYIAKYDGYVSDAYITKLGASFPACSGDDRTAAPKPGDSPSHVDSGDASGLVAEARKWAGTHETGNNCNPFSTALGRGCEAWCADFVEYVWQQGGMATDDVTAYAGSFLTYGQNHGTLKPRDSDDVQPGDAVVWARTATDAAHVGMVTEVLSNGDVRVMNGNYADQVEETVHARSSTVEGYGIAGFVSPVAQ
jgi:uncharacterized protein (TIGR02594 family)